MSRERAAGKRLYARYHARAPGLRHFAELAGDRRNPGNTSVWAHRDRVYTLCPAGLPTEIDPDDLTTIAETTFGGVVAPGFSAHASYSAPRRAFYNFGLRAGPRSWLDLYVFPDDGLRVERLCDLATEGPRVDPRVEMRRQRYVYATHLESGGEGPPERLAKLDTKTGRAEVFGLGDGVVPAEGVFVPRTGSTREDDGWLVTIVNDLARGESCLAVLAADRPGEPPVARAWLGQRRRRRARPRHGDA